MATANQWTTEAGQVPEGGFVDGDFNAHAAQDLNGAGTRNGTNSIRRTGQTDRNHKGDWSFGARLVRARQLGASCRSLSERMRSRSCAASSNRSAVAAACICFSRS